MQLNNGVLVIQVPNGRTVVVGPPDKILASGIRLIKSDSMVRVAAGAGNPGSIELTQLPGLASNVIQSANTILGNLHHAASSMVASGGGNMVAAGGGNLVGQDEASLIGQDGNSMVAAGAGNIFSTSTGNLIQSNGVVSLPNK